MLVYEYDNGCMLTIMHMLSVNLFFYHSHTQDGWTALMSASHNGHHEIVEKLLAARAKPDLQDKVFTVTTMCVCRQLSVDTFTH